MVGREVIAAAGVRKAQAVAGSHQSWRQFIDDESCRCSATRSPPGDGALQTLTTRSFSQDQEVVDELAVGVSGLGADAGRGGDEVARRRSPGPAAAARRRTPPC